MPNSNDKTTPDASKTAQKQQRPDGGYWADPRNDPAAPPTSDADDSNLTGTDLQPGDEEEQAHSLHRSARAYDQLNKPQSSQIKPASPQTMREDEAQFDAGQATTPGTSSRSPASAAPGKGGSGGKAKPSQGSTGSAGSGGSGSGDAGAVGEHPAELPGNHPGTSASGTDDTDDESHLGSGGTGAGLPDGTKGN